MIPAAPVRESSIVTRDRTTDAIRTELYTTVIVEKRLTVEEIAARSGLKPDTVKSYMRTGEGGREPCLSSALSLAVVLGPRAVRSILALIGWTGEPADNGAGLSPMQLVADVMGDLATIAIAAADNRFDHTERRDVTRSADHIIEILGPVSSAGWRE